MTKGKMTEKKIRPLADRLTVIADKAEDVTYAGLVIPEQSKEAKQTGKVVGVGSKCEDVKVGDTVIFGKYAGSEIVLENITYLILKEEEVFCVVE